MMQKADEFAVVRVGNDDLCLINQMAEIEKCLIPCPWPQYLFVSEVKKNSAIVLAALYNNEVAGYLTSDTVLDEVSLTNLAVCEKYQRIGIATALFNELLQYIKNMAVIFLEVREKNINARSLYKKLGFTEIGLRKNYYCSPNDNAILMKYTIAKD